MLQDRIDKAREDMEKMKKLRLDLDESDPIAPKQVISSPTPTTERTIVKGQASPRDEVMMSPGSKRSGINLDKSFKSPNRNE